MYCVLLHTYSYAIFFPSPRWLSYQFFKEHTSPNQPATVFHFLQARQYTKVQVA